MRLSTSCSGIPQRMGKARRPQNPKINRKLAHAHAAAAAGGTQHGVPAPC
jgi:hypothetical protein